MTTKNQYPVPTDSRSDEQKPLNHFPLTGETLRAQNLQMLQSSIFASEADKRRRDAGFKDVLRTNTYQKGQETLFQAPAESSPFSQFSSQGWKFHVAFELGHEEEVARLLYRNGLYFKVQKGMGTYFRGGEESGATVYVGSRHALDATAKFAGNHLGPILRDPIPMKVAGKTVLCGSGGDVELITHISARFDVAKSPFAHKYHPEGGSPSWTVVAGVPSGLPYLREDQEAIAKLENSDPQVGVLVDAYRGAFTCAKAELVRDFGEDFVLGPPYLAGMRDLTQER